MSGAFRIGELAGETRVKVVTIRYYERIGLMPPAKRTAANYRSYGDDARKRLAFIRRCRDLGFTLDQIRDLLRLSSDRAMPCAEVKRIAVQHQKAVAAKLKDLQSLLDELRRISNSCRGTGSVADCQIVEALSLARMARKTVRSRQESFNLPAKAGHS
jgi:DNA-binding transcriptional MerR regulator